MKKYFFLVEQGEQLNDYELIQAKDDNALNKGFSGWEGETWKDLGYT